MGVFAYVQTFWAQSLASFSPGTSLRFVSGAAGAELQLFNPATAQLNRIILANANQDAVPALVQNQTLVSAATMISAEIGRSFHQLYRLAVDGLSENHNSQHSYLDRSGFIGNLINLHRLDIDGQSYVFMAMQAGNQITSFRREPDGTLTRMSFINDTETSYVQGVSALASISTSTGHYLLAASPYESGLTLFKVGTTGGLSAIASFGAAEQLPINTPTQMRTIEYFGGHFIVLGGYGSSSITILQMDEDGTLRLTDHVLDSLETRFAGVAAIDIYMQDGLLLIAAAGCDGGVSLFQLLPQGRLILRDTVVDQTKTALQNIEQLCFAQVAGQLQLFALATGDQGLTRLNLDLTEIVSVVLHGSQDNDILTAGTGSQAVTGATLSGLGGSDLLIDGSGSDTLSGGAGADVFMLAP